MYIEFQPALNQVKLRQNRAEFSRSKKNKFKCKMPCKTLIANKQLLKI